MFPEPRQPRGGDPGSILMAAVLFIVSLAFPGRFLSKVLQMLAVILLVIACPLLGVPLLIYFVLTR